MARVIEPLEFPAPTSEILEGVESCHLALGDDGKFDASIFQNLHWRRGGTYPPDEAGGIRTEYYNRNIVNDILIMSRIDGCFTKAKLVNQSQITEVRQQLMNQYALEQLNGQARFAQVERTLVGRFGEVIRENVLVCDRFMLILEHTLRADESYLTITYAPVV